MASAGGQAGILSITLRVRTSRGEEIEIAVNPAEYDALFLSLDATENILVPFYAARDGLASALELREEATRRIKQAGALLVLHRIHCRRLVPELTSESGSLRL